MCGFKIDKGDTLILRWFTILNRKFDIYAAFSIKFILEIFLKLTFTLSAPVPTKITGGSSLSLSYVAQKQWILSNQKSIYSERKKIVLYTKFNI